MRTYSLTGADGARYHWYNTHPTSFTQLTTSKITYRLIAAAVLAGLAKLLLKIIPSLIFSTLFKLKVIQPAAIHLKDCFDRAVPDAKSYVVEIPVRCVVTCLPIMYVRCVFFYLYECRLMHVHMCTMSDSSYSHVLRCTMHAAMRLTSMWHLTIAIVTYP